MRPDDSYVRAKPQKVNSGREYLPPLEPLRRLWDTNALTTMLQAETL
jgi:hypothetical protein